MRNILIIALAFTSSLLFGNDDVLINEISASNSLFLDNYGEADDWIELYNSSASAIDLNLYYISDNLDDPQKWQLLESFAGELIIQPNSYLILWADKETFQGAFHVDFTLKKNGESVILTSPDLINNCAITYPALLNNVSYGYDETTATWNYYDTMTQGAINNTTTFEGITSLVDYSISGGLFDAVQTISLTTSLPGSEIRYTTDNSEPTISSSLYSSPLSISVTTNLRTKVFKPNFIPNISKCMSYIFDGDFTLNIVSIAGNQAELFGGAGIYNNPYDDVEIPVSFSYFEADGTPLFSQNLGLKIHAPDNTAQKSLRFYARSEYGESKIDYPLFDERSYSNYKRIILRNGGNDAINLGKTLMRDVLGTTMFGDLDEEYGWSAFVPVHAFLNGEYWGIYNMRERQDNHWLKQNYGYEPEEVDYLERAAQGSTFAVFSGDWNNYNAMHQTAIDLDLSDDDNYAVIANWMNIENFVDYEMSEIFYGNQDWLSNNMKLWKPLDDSRKWEWIIWDVDYGMGRFYPNYPVGNPDFNYLNFATSNWGGWTSNVETYLLQNLLENQGFVDYFSSRGADLMNSIFRSDSVQLRINSLSQTLSPDIQRHFSRWNQNSMSTWSGQVDWLGSFMSQRPDFVRQHFTEKFNLGEIYPINLTSTPIEGGYIEVNTIETDALPWIGYYYETIPVRIKAIAYPGYSFLYWLETGETDQELFVDMISAQNYTAVYQNTGVGLPVVINEIFYQGTTSGNGDWVELYNYGLDTFDISGYTLKDLNNNSFSFPENSFIYPNEYIIAANDTVTFGSSYPDIIGNINVFNMNNAFGLNSIEDAVILSRPDEFEIDRVHYMNVVDSWPTTSAGQSIQLFAPTSNNNDGTNWFTNSANLETPGAINIPSGISMELDLKVFLQGPYDINSLLMLDGLRVNNHLPLEEPYSALNFVQVGSGGETTTETVLDVTGNNAIVDWIFIELRDPVDPTIIIATQAALIQRDGNIVGMDGVSTIQFNNVNSNEVYIVLRHRNHLGIRTTQTYLTNELSVIDFSNTSTIINGLQPMIVIGDIQLMFAGDANRDGQINPIDKNNFWRTENGGAYNYINTKADFNLDGVVNPVDKNDYWRVNNSMVEELD